MMTRAQCSAKAMLVCPYCGHHDVQMEWETSLNEIDDNDELTCGACGKQYEVSRKVEVEYTTRPMGGWANAQSGGKR